MPEDKTSPEQVLMFEKKEDVTEEHIDKLLSIFSRINTCSVWSKVTRGDFDIKRFEAGFVNDICACVLTEEAKARLRPSNNDVTGVVVKIFPEKFFLPVNPVQRGLICSMIACRGLGPKLIYMDEHCCVNEYLQESRHPLIEDDRDTKFAGKVIRKLAEYHTLPVPVSQVTFEQWRDIITGILQKGFPGSKYILNGEYLDFLKAVPELEEYCKEFEGVDFLQYFEYFFNGQVALDSPIVFSHCDFHRGNRLITEKKLPDGSIEKDIFFIDFDSSGYFFRGLDIGAYFDSFLQEKQLFGTDGFASDEDMLPVIEEYRQECARFLGEEYLLNEQNSVQRILREAKFFGFYYYFISIYFCLGLFCENPTKNVQFARDACARRVMFKQVQARFSEEGILPDVGIQIQ